MNIHKKNQKKYNNNILQNKKIKVDVKYGYKIIIAMNKFVNLVNMNNIKYKNKNLNKVNLFVMNINKKFNLCNNILIN